MTQRKQGNGARRAETDTRGVGQALKEEAASGALLYETRNSLPSEARARVVELMNRRLADCVDLQSQCKQAHWNVKGPQFIALHTLFDDVYGAVGEYVDLIAERIVQLGGIAEGTVRVAAERSTLAEYPLVLSSGEDHVAALANALARFGREARQCIEEIEPLDDADTVDLLTEVTRGVDKWLWFVEAHEQQRPQRSSSSRTKR